jgi:hypothetical protein
MQSLYRNIILLTLIAIIESGCGILPSQPSNIIPSDCVTPMNGPQEQHVAYFLDGT